MTMDRISLGFDLRVNPGVDQPNGLGDARFLDPLNSSRISADPSVWLASDRATDLWGTNLPHFLNPLRLAGDTNRLLDAYNREGIDTSELYPLCITSAPGIAVSLRQRFGAGYFDHKLGEEELVSAGWHFRGFDVVDLDGLISGLKGCDYREPAWSQLRTIYAEHLNEDGLFFHALTASQFAEVRGLEIRQHAPFVVVGLLSHPPLGRSVAAPQASQN
jgi:hypothetical protein